ncbi:MAG: PQQ-binding-like beta-propeller repeat protein, partial [Candidatus Thermoplasmatota archaeon]|nr:PQQ-binding-like beta-propeller repeat protein [Candidatus Thermoplasmatota archaeon]
LTWEDYEESGTSIKYHILYENDTGYDNLVEETYLNGNEEGFSSPPVYLDSIPAEYEIKIKADLTTNDPSSSPEINSWGITWQTQDKIWKDLLNSSLRVSERHNVLIANGDASVILSINDWPMFGQNSANTRSSDGYGPDDDNHDIYWYSTTKSGSGYKNPVIKEGILYIASSNGSKLYAYDATVSPGNEGSPTTTVAQIDVPENDIAIENSPAVSNDNVVVATGTTADGGKVENKVYAFDTNTLSENPTWIFEYNDINPDNPYICYSASPTVSNDKIFLSSWSGDSLIWNSIWKYFNFSIGNNKLIVLDSNGNFEWKFDLPAGSFSSPAVYENTVVVGCERINGNSLFAIDADSGEQIWSKNVGPIGRASPVIYEGRVFVATKEPATASFTAYTKVVALNLDDGTKVWNTSIGDSIPDGYKLSACSTPTIYNDVLFVASSDGTLYALDTENGEEKWSKKIYTKPLTPLLTSSPAYADGLIYIGTPDGILYAIDASDGSTAWNKDTYQNSAMLSSPVVVDGLIYYASENGMLFSRGELQGTEGEQITGNIVSIPIRLPDPAEDYIWDKFYVSYFTSEGDIDFSILDEDKNELLKNIDDGSNVSTTNVNNHDTILLRADFAASTDGEATVYEWSISFKN